MGRNITQEGGRQSKEGRTGRAHHTGMLKKRSAPIRTTPQRAWRVVGNIASMPAWAPGVTEVHITSERKNRVGAVREVVFDDGRRIEEHITSWDAGSGFTYVATSGLPLRAYVATITIRPYGRGMVQIAWQSYLNSTAMTESEFGLLLEEMGSFYQMSLANLKGILHEGKR